MWSITMIITVITIDIIFCVMEPNLVVGVCNDARCGRATDTPPVGGVPQLGRRHRGDSLPQGSRCTSLSPRAHLRGRREVILFCFCCADLTSSLYIGSFQPI